MTMHRQHFWSLVPWSNVTSESPVSSASIMAVEDGGGILASDGRNFDREVANYAYGEYLCVGFGAVVISGGRFQVNFGGGIGVVFMYIPSTDISKLLPVEAA